MEVRPGYKQTQIGMVPGTWKICSLGTICDVRDGTHESPRFFATGVPFVTSKNIVDGQLDLENVSYISEADAVEFNKRSKVDRNDILMSMIGTIGSAALIESEPDFCVKNVALLKPRRVEPSFLIHLINSPLFQQYLAENLDGGIQKFVSLGTLRQLAIPVPDESEQRAIASALSDVDALLGGLDRLIAKKRDLKQAAMQQLLTGQTRLPGFSGEWEVKGLKYFVTQDRFAIVDGPFGSQLKVEEYVKSGVPVIEMEHLGDDYITERIERCITPKKFEDLKRSAVHPGDIIVSKTGSLGKLGLIPEGVKRGLITSRLAKITLDPLRADRFFVFQCLSKLRSEGYWEKVSQGGTMQILGIGMLQNAPIPNISIPEQTAIAAVLSDMDAELSVLVARRDKTRALKQGMMQELLTGRTRLV